MNHPSPVPRTVEESEAVQLTEVGRNGSEPESQSCGPVGVAGSEDALLRRYAKTGDPHLKEDLVRRFLPLARSLALRYRATPEPLEDLIQVASLGLVKALDGFDLERGKSFNAYAAPTILGELRRHFRDRVRGLRLPRRLQERTMEMREVAAALSEEMGRTPTIPQIAERLELSEEEVLETVQADSARRTLSLDVPRGSEDKESEPMIDTLGGSEAGYDQVEAQLAAESARLTERERTVLRLRFEDDLNQREIGRRLGVSQMQVSRIMRPALRKILRAVQGDEVPGGPDVAVRASPPMARSDCRSPLRPSRSARSRPTVGSKPPGPSRNYRAEPSSEAAP